MTEKTLNEIFEFDTVVEITPSGDPIVRRDLHAPEVYQELDAEGYATLGEPTTADDWTLLTGFTGQHGYKGAGLHSSEAIGGGLERHIRENPGLYFASAVTYIGPEENYDPDSWVVAFKPLGHDDDRHTDCDAADCRTKAEALKHAEITARATGSVGSTYVVEGVDPKTGIRYVRVSATWTREDAK